MGFRIKEISGFGSSVEDNDFYVPIKEAEARLKKGQKTITIKKPSMWDFQPFIGQVFKYKAYHNDDRELANIYRLVSGVDAEYRKRVGGGQVEDKAGTLTFEIITAHLPSKDKFITKREAQTILDDFAAGIYQVGKYVINSSGSYGRIKSLAVVDIVDPDLTNERPMDNPHCDDIMMDAVQVTIEHESGRDNRVEAANPDFKSEKTYYASDFNQMQKDWKVIMEDDLVAFERKIGIAIEQDSLDVFDDSKLLLGEGSKNIDKSANVDPTSELIGLSNTAQLEVMKNDAAKGKNMAESINQGMARIVMLKKEEFEIALEKEKGLMEALKADLMEQIEVFNKKMRKIQRLITTLEIYLGESENVYQIAEGEKASLDEPIHLRQMMLYMDEEFGDATDGGLDFTTIDQFEKWLVETENYNLVVPEEKCVVVMRPRRKNKDYGEVDAFTSEIWNRENKKYYILIRNGYNLYRIWTDKIEFGGRLFPLRDEFQNLMNEMQEAMNERAEHEIDSYSWKRADDKLDGLEAQKFKYIRTFLLLQGIVVRTDIFAPIPHDLNLLKVDSHEGLVKFIYDEEDVIADGRPEYNDWLSTINESIVKGSRIHLSSPRGNVKNWEDRFTGYLSEGQLYNLRLPASGIYEVKEGKDKFWDYKTELITREEYDAAESMHEQMKVKHKVVTKHGRNMSSTSYNFPDGYQKKYEKHYNQPYPSKGMVRVKVLDENGQAIRENLERKYLYISYSYEHQWTDNMIHKRFRIKQSDNFIINFDALLIDDLTYYINSRLHRPNYLHMMPVLKGLRKELGKEKAWEQNFVTLTRQELIREYAHLAEIDLDDMIWEAIDWWKNKLPTIHKRAISKNDGKALEKITQRVKKMCNKKHKTNVDVGSNYKTRLLVWNFGDYIFYGTGMTKKEFTKQVLKLQETHVAFMYAKGFSKVADQVRSVNNPELMKLAKVTSGKIVWRNKTLAS